MKNRKKLSIIVVVLVIFITGGGMIFFQKNTAKVSKIGNNSSSQEIVEHFLGMNSYELTAEVTIYSNKNTNQYTIKQGYTSPDKNSQEVIEPSNIKGVKIVREGNRLTLENTSLKLTSVLENYEHIADNNIDLSTFAQDYQKDEKAGYREEGESILLETSCQKESIYSKNKILTIDRKTGNPTKMEIKGANQKTMIYIVYNEVKISNNKTKNTIAFKLNPIAKEI